MQNAIRKIIEKSDTPSSRTFDILIQFLILIGVASFALETVPRFIVYEELFKVLEVVIIACFTMEYFLRIWVSQNRWAYITSFAGIMDSLSIIPFYLRIGDLRFLRLFRLTLIFKIFKTSRFSAGLELMGKVLKTTAPILVPFVTMAIMTAFFAATGIYFAENRAQPDVFTSIPGCMWWAIVTMTTVGYGDAFPITVLGKVFASVVMVIGICLIAVPTGLLSASFATRIDELHRMTRHRVEPVNPEND